MTTSPATPRAEDGTAGTSRMSRAPAARMLRAPAVLVITVTGLFHLWWRGALVDGVVFLLVVVALVAGDLVGSRSPSMCRPTLGRAALPRALAAAPAWQPLQAPGSRLGNMVRGRMLTAVAVASVAACYGWLVSKLAWGGWAVLTALAVPGVIAGVLAWPQCVTVTRRSRAAGRWAWASVLVLACMWQLTAFLLQQQPVPGRLYDHPTVSVFIDPLVRSQPGRGVGLAVWLAGGYVLLRRAQAANTVTKGADGGRDG